MAELNVRALTGSMFDFARPVGADLLARTEDFDNWRHLRSESGLWPFSRVIHDAPGPDMDIADERGNSRPGVSLACQDYLGLTSHPAIREAATKALHDLGPHSAGSPALAGNTQLSLRLEQELGQALGYEHVVLFPTGWAAGYAGIAGLVRPDDHIVMDQLSHACLQQGAFAATRNVRRHAHLDVGSVESALREIRSVDTTNGIMVISEGLFSMDSDVPDIAALQAVCHQYGATFLLDVAHDFGSLGPRGGGSLADQGMLGKVDLVMGSFSKTFSSNGGFVATRSRAVRQYLKFYGSPQTFSNALSPIQSAVVLEALRIVRSDEGETLRQGLMRNVLALREELSARGIQCIGAPSAIVPALVGDEAAGRIAWAEATGKGIHANLVEFPAVAVGAARFRMQLMPTHRHEQIVRAAEVVAVAIENARKVVAGLKLPERRRPRVGPDAGTCAVGARALPSLKPGDLAKLFDGARIESHKAGTCLIQAGTNHGNLYVLRKGGVEIVVDHLGMQVVVGTCREGEIVGEMSMLDGKGASASVFAETDVEVACLDQAAVRKLAAADPDFGCRLYLSLAQVLARRLRYLDVHTLSAEFTV
jgi:glycine C-acetyltransferase